MALDASVLLHNAAFLKGGASTPGGAQRRQRGGARKPKEEGGGENSLFLPSTSNKIVENRPCGAIFDSERSQYLVKNRPWGAKMPQIFFLKAIIMPLKFA